MSRHATGYLAVAFTAIALYNALELLILIFVTFKRYRGLYFWSLLVATAVGVIPYALGNLMLYFELVNRYVALAICSIPGWYSMVIGQALVLYSRLHLVLKDKRTLRSVLIMIIVTAVVLMPTTTVLTFGTGGDPRNKANPSNFATGYSIMEKIQMTLFCIQEFIISGLYLWETRRILKTTMHSWSSQSLKTETDAETSVKRRRPRNQYRRTMLQLIWINVFIIIIDVALLGIEYANLYTLETTFKGAVYSVKLRLEFAVLSQLVSISGHSNTRYSSHSDEPFNSMSFETGLEGGDQQQISSSVAYSSSMTQPRQACSVVTADDILGRSTSVMDSRSHRAESTEQDTQVENKMDINSALTIDYNQNNGTIRANGLRRIDTWAQDYAYR